MRKMRQISTTPFPEAIPENGSESSPSKLTEGIGTFNGLGDHDVLCGRGNRVNKRPGNLKFRSYVESQRQAYNDAPRSDKIGIARRVVHWVHNNGGRFLRYKGSVHEDVFVEIGLQRSVEKVCQALRLRESGRRSRQTRQANQKEEAGAASQYARISAAQTDCGLVNKNNCLWEGAIHPQQGGTQSGESYADSSDDDDGQFDDADQLDDDEFGLMAAKANTEAQLEPALEEEHDDMLDAYSCYATPQSIRTVEEDDDIMMIEPVSYIANPREKPGVLLPPRSPSPSSFSAARARKQQAPTHRLMLQSSSQDTSQQMGETSGWFVDYFTNGGSSDTSSEASKRYWEQLFLDLVRFKEVYGHCCIPPSACSPHPCSSKEEREHARLADWASVQRQRFREIQHSRRTATDEEKDQFQRLKVLGFVFNYEEWHWNNKYNELVKFQQQQEERKTKSDIGSKIFQDRTEFAKCLGLALWVKEQRQLYKQGNVGNINAMPADRVKKLELVNNFSWATDANTESLGKSPESVVAFASALAGTSKSKANSVKAKAMRDQVSLSTSLNGTAKADVLPMAQSSSSACLSSAQCEHLTEKDAIVAPETPAWKTNRSVRAVTPETALISTSSDLRCDETE